MGREANKYHSFLRGFSFSVRIESEDNFLEFALAKELVIANSLFRNKNDHLITYKSNGRTTQVDYCLVRKGDKTLCLDCKVVLGIEMSTQHSLLVLVFQLRKKIFEKKIEFRGTIM